MKKIKGFLIVASLAFVSVSFAETKPQDGLKSPQICFFGTCFQTRGNGDGWRPPTKTE